MTCTCPTVDFLVSFKMVVHEDLTPVWGYLV